MLLALLVGVPLGILAALRVNGVADHVLRTTAVLGIAMPSFVTGPLFALVIGDHLHWLPVAGWVSGDPRYAVLPVITLAFPVGALCRTADACKLYRGAPFELHSHGPCQGHGRMARDRHVMRCDLG